MKRSLPFLALSAVLLATACGGDEAGNGGDGTLAAEDPQSVTGTVTWWDTSNEAEGPAYDQLIEEFEAEYPNITVERVTVSFDSAEQRFKTAAQSGDGAPDVLRSDVGWIAGLASLGYLQPLDGTMLLDEIDAFMEGPVEAATYDGEIFGVPPGHRHPRTHLQPRTLRRGRRRGTARHLGRVRRGRTDHRGGDRGARDPTQPRGLLHLADDLRRGR